MFAPRCAKCGVCYSTAAVPPNWECPNAACNKARCWQPDSDAPVCSQCQGKFRFLFKKRHHCRLCGFACCERCSSFVGDAKPPWSAYPSEQLVDEVIRVCIACQQNKTTAATVNDNDEKTAQDAKGEEGEGAADADAAPSVVDPSTSYDEKETHPESGEIRGSRFTDAVSEDGDTAEENDATGAATSNHRLLVQPSSSSSRRYAVFTDTQERQHCRVGITQWLRTFACAGSSDQAMKQSAGDADKTKGSSVLVAGSKFKTVADLEAYLKWHLAKPAVAAKVKEFKLSEDEALAVVLYTVDCQGIFATVNRLLRTQTPKSEAALQPYAPFVAWLLRGMRRLPEYSGVVFRALGTKEHTTEYTRGRELAYPQFTSCTTRLSEGILKVFGKGNGALLAVDVAGARGISALSVFPDEAEVVLQPGWSGRVLGCVHDDTREILSGNKYEGIGNVDLRPFTVLEMVQTGLVADDRDVDSKGGLVLARFPVQIMKDKISSAACSNANDFDADSIATLHNNLGLLLKEVFGDTDGAKQHYEEALKLAPTATYCSNLGMLLRDAFEDYEGARKYLERAIELEPETGLYYNNLANLLERFLDDFQGALVNYEAALEHDPENSKIAFNLACLHENHLDDQARARDCFRRAVELDPCYAEAHNALAVLLTDHFQQYDEARVHFDTAIAIAPSNFYYRFLFADMLVKAGDYKAAKQQFEMAHNIDPSDTFVDYRLSALIEEHDL